MQDDTEPSRTTTTHTNGLDVSDTANILPTTKQQHKDSSLDLKRKRPENIVASSPSPDIAVCQEPCTTTSTSTRAEIGSDNLMTTIAYGQISSSSPPDNRRTSSRSLSPCPSPVVQDEPRRRHRRLASSPPDFIRSAKTMTTAFSMHEWGSPYLEQVDGKHNHDNNNNTDANVEEENDDNDDGDESSIETQESEYLVDCSSKYTNSTNRLTCFVYKRKEGLSGKMKQSYAVASEKRKYIGHKVHQNIGLVGLGWSGNGKDFWKLGKGNVTANTNASTSASASGLNANVVPQVKMWERRRLVLEGRLLMYYHEDAALDELEDDEDDDKDDDKEKEGREKQQELEDCQNKSCKGSGENEQDNCNKDNDYDYYKQREESGRSINTMFSKYHSSGLQRWRDKINELAEHAHFKSPSQAVINTPKGVIDLVASCASATIVPISRHSFAPTPYCLAILVKSEVKWMLCFEDEREILKWLNVFTNVALKQSVERYCKNHGKAYPMESGHCNIVARCSKNGDEKMHGNHHSPIGNQPLSTIRESGDVTGTVEDDAKKLRSDKSLLSAMSLVDYDAYRVVALVNSAFLYLFLVVEEVTTISHIVAFIIVNIFTWLHIRNGNNRIKRQFTMDKLHDSESHQLSEVNSINRRDSLSSNVAANEEEVKGENTPKDGRQLVASSSFIERRKSEDNDDQSNTNRPVAGSTTMQFKNPHESHLNSDNEEMVAWIAANPSIIQLRGADYLISKKKVPSLTSLYELVELDAFDSDEHMTDVGQQFRFSRKDFGTSGNWCAPDTLIISFALPTTAPKLGRSSSDGKGYIVCGYYRIRSEVRKVLEIISNSQFDANARQRQIELLFPDAQKRSIVNGVKLWEKWCGTSATDPEMQKRLKFIPRGENLNELGVPSWICRYNGKPMLIKRPGETSFIFSHPDDRTLEIDVNLHPLPFMFKQAMAYLKEHYFARMLMTFGFVIEGREEDELPEVLLGNPIQLPFNNPGAVMKGKALFGGSDTASF